MLCDYVCGIVYYEVIFCVDWVIDDIMTGLLGEVMSLSVRRRVVVLDGRSSRASNFEVFCHGNYR